MLQLTVKAKKLNKRKFVPASLPDPGSITGTVNQGFSFLGEEVMNVPNPLIGKWFKDRDNNFYWGGGLDIFEEPVNDNASEFTQPDNTALENIPITPLIKTKIEQVINAFETGSAQGNYATLVKLKDYTDPVTKALMVQVTFGRSQTTEFGHLKALVQDYVNSNGTQANVLHPFLDKIGKKPSLAIDDIFCNALKTAGKTDPVMKTCQDRLFEAKYYQPAFNWFTQNGFTLPLSMLVIYDSTIHSGSVLSFLRKRFPTVVPASGGNEKDWITNYVNVRHNWLANHSNPILRNTVYRTECFKQQLAHNNWDLSQTINAHGVNIN